MWIKSIVHNARPSSWWIRLKQTNMNQCQRRNINISTLFMAAIRIKLWELKKKSERMSPCKCAHPLMQWVISITQRWHCDIQDNVTKGGVISLKVSDRKDQHRHRIFSGTRSPSADQWKRSDCLSHTKSDNLAQQPDRSEFNSEIPLIRLTNLRWKAFSDGLKISVDSPSYHKLS